MRRIIPIICLLLLACTAGPASAIDFNDDFNSTPLGSAWTLSDPDHDDTCSLTARAGYMRLKLASGGEDSWTGATWAAARNSAPFLLTTLVNPSEDFTVETLVDAATVNGGIMPDKFVAGIMVYDTAHETTPYVTWQGPTEYFGYDMGFALYRDSSQTGLANPSILAQTCNRTNHGSSTLDLTKAYHLKMVRDSAAATWTCSYKQDGASAWTEVAAVNDWEFPGDGVTGTLKIGLYAKTWIGGAATPGADFGYFTITSVPEPGSIWLVSSALIGMLAFAWRRRK